MVRRQVENGRVVYIPEIEPTVAKPTAVPMTSEFWQLPQNEQELVDAVSWAAGGQTLLDTDAASTTVLELLVQRESGNLFLHMINYDAARVPSVGPVKVAVRVAGEKSFGQVTVMSPDRGSDVVIPHKVASGSGTGATLSFTVPKLETYNLVVIQPG